MNDSTLQKISQIPCICRVKNSHRKLDGDENAADLFRCATSLVTKNGRYAAALNRKHHWSG